MSLSTEIPLKIMKVALCVIGSYLRVSLESVVHMLFNTS